MTHQKEEFKLEMEHYKALLAKKGYTIKYYTCRVEKNKVILSKLNTRKTKLYEILLSEIGKDWAIMVKVQ